MTQIKQLPPYLDNVDFEHAVEFFKLGALSLSLPVEVVYCGNFVNINFRLTDIKNKYITELPLTIQINLYEGNVTVEIMYNHEVILEKVSEVLHYHIIWEKVVKIQRGNIDFGIYHLLNNIRFFNGKITTYKDEYRSNIATTFKDVNDDIVLLDVSETSYTDGRYIGLVYQYKADETCVFNDKDKLYEYVYDKILQGKG